MRRLLLALLLLVVAPHVLEATVRTVKTSGGNHTTISACAAVAVAGDSCEVYVGTYAGWTQPTSGTAGNPITFLAHPGETVTITSAAIVNDRSYITINGFRWTAGTVLEALETNLGSHITFTNNTVVGNGVDFAIYLYGNDNLISGNELSGTADFVEMGGTRNVVRNNIWRDVNAGAQGTSEHIDGVQVVGGVSPTLSFTLIEGNIERNCLNDGGNCHFILVRSSAILTADTVIARYNTIYNMDGSGVSYGGGTGELVPNASAYNNTIATGALINEASMCVSGFSTVVASNLYALNNICYQTTANGVTPLSFSARADGNLVYNPGYSGAWDAPYSSEATYAALVNKNPLFVAYPTNFNLQAASPARNAGVPLTYVAVADTSSGTSLIVTNAHLFQPGWAGASADVLRIGPTTTATVSSINYTTNTITLTAGVTRADGDPVYLYKNSSGTQVLFGAAPDVGAYPYGVALPTAPNAPTNIRVP